MNKNDMNKWCVAIVGMNATGKSNFGKSLASKLSLNRIDSDSEFRKKYGDIKKYIDENGFDSYRALEEKIIVESLRLGNVVVLSGGSIESEKIRSALKHASVIWIQAGKKRVVRNIKEAKSPRYEFSEGSPDEVAKSLIEKRNDLYKEVSDIVIREGTPYSKYCSTAIAELKKYYSGHA